MAQMKRMDAGPRTIINGYGDGGFRISGRSYKGAVLVYPAGCTVLDIERVEDLSPKHLDILVEGEEPTEILLIGCGETMQALPEDLRTGLGLAGIAADPMDSRAAARTYNILVMERRRVAAVLLPL